MCLWLEILFLSNLLILGRPKALLLLLLLSCRLLLLLLLSYSINLLLWVNELLLIRWKIIRYSRYTGTLSIRIMLLWILSLNYLVIRWSFYNRWMWLTLFVLTTYYLSVLINYIHLFFRGRSFWFPLMYVNVNFLILVTISALNSGFINKTVRILGIRGSCVSSFRMIEIAYLYRSIQV